MMTVPSSMTNNSNNSGKGSDTGYENDIGSHPASSVNDPGGPDTECVRILLTKQQISIDCVARNRKH